MRPSTKRMVSLLLSGLFLIGALVVYANFLKPEYNEIQKLRGAFKAKSSLFNEQKDIIGQVKDLLTQFQDIAKFRETVTLALPVEESAASLFQQIFAISQLSGLSVQSFGIKPALVRNNGLAVLQLSLKLAGSYGSLKEFLNFLETNIRIMDVSQLRMQAGGQPKQDLFSYNLTINTYYQQ